MPDDLIRPSEAERDRVIASLSDHFALGRLTSEEFDQRVGQALRATTRDQLKTLLLDLPAEPLAGPQPVPPDVPGSTDLTTRRPWMPWAGTAMICLVIWLATSVAAGSALYFWPVWVIGPWGLATVARSRCQGNGAQLRQGCQMWLPAAAPPLHENSSSRRP